MAGTVGQDSLGVEDITRHDPAAGPTTQFLNRDSRLAGGTVPITKVSAASIPVLDAAVVSGANTPFDEIADTQAAKHVEACLADIRKNYAELKNFDHYGGIAGSGISAADAQKNTEVFNKILTDMVADGQVNGIFFPASTYEFMEFGGFMPKVDQYPNLRLVGTGFASCLKRNTSAVTNQNLLSIIDSPDVTVADLFIDRNGTAGTNGALAFTGFGVQPIGGVKVLNCYISGGQLGLVLGSAGFQMDNFWVSGCTFGATSSLNMEAFAASNGHILSNQLQGGGTGILIASAGGADLLRDIDVVGNVLTGTGMDLSVIRGGVFAAASHRGVNVLGNRLTAGNIAITGIDSPDVSGNKLAAGKIAVTMDAAMVTAKNVRLAGNEVVGATGPGILLAGSGTAIEGFEISGGKVESATQQGIAIQCAGALAKWGRIAEVLVLNCSREDAAATDYSGILLDCPGGGGAGVFESIIVNNIIRCTTVTSVNGNKHLYGVEEKAGGSSNKNMIGPNFAQGYVTADVLLSGAASLDYVARMTLLDALFARFDGGAAV